MSLDYSKLVPDPAGRRFRFLNTEDGKVYNLGEPIPVVKKKPVEVPPEENTSEAPADNSKTGDK